MPVATDEARLIERARKSDRKAIGELYDRYVQSIYRYVHLRVNDIHTAEDITAEVFLRALEGLSTFEHRGFPFSAWLYRIAHDKVVDHYRRQDRRQNTTELVDSVPDEDQDPHRIVMHDIETRHLKACLEKLPEEQRLVIILRLIERQPAEQVGRVLGKSPGAVRVIQHRALAALSRLMEEVRV